MSVQDRAAVVDHLLEKLASTRKAPYRSHATLLSGERGVGKSRVLKTFTTKAQALGVQVVEVHCVEGDDRPHGPIIDCLNGLVGQCGQKLESLPKVNRALKRLSGLSPENSRGRIGETLSKGYLAESIRQGVLEIYKHAHMCIIVHDVHKAEPATQDISAYLLEDLLADSVFEWAVTDQEDARSPAMHGAYMVFAFRASAPMERLQTLSNTSGSIDAITLAPLNLEGVRRYLADEEVAQAFLDKSGGMPLRLAQMISAMPSDPNTYWVDRAHALSQPLRERLDILAVAAHPMTPRQLDDLASSRAAVITVVEEVPDLILPVLNNGRPCITFRREAERETWYERMAAEMREGIHGLLAERMAAGLYGQPETIARHFLGAKRPQDAIPFVMETIPQLRRAHAYTRAANLLEAILDAASGDLQIEVMQTLVECFIATGEHAKAQSMVGRLKAISDELDEELFLTELSIHIEVRNLEEIRKMEAQVSDSANPDFQQRCLAALSESALRDGDLEKAFELCASVVDLDECQHDFELDLRNTLGKVYLFKEAFDDAERVFVQNLAWAEGLNATQHQAKSMINLGVVLLQRGLVERALTQFENVRSHCEQEGDVPHLAVALENLAVLHYRKRSFKEALFFYHRSAATSRRLGRLIQFCTTILNLGDLYLTVGDLHKSTRLSDIARSYIERNRYPFLEPQLLTLEGDIAQFGGDYATATERYGRAEHLIRTGSMSNQRLIPLLLATSELHLDNQSLDDAEKKLSEALHLVSAMHEGLALRLRITHGAILGERGELSEARHELEAAVHGATESGDLEALWLAHMRLGLTYWRLDEQSKALGSMQNAIKETHRLIAHLPKRLRRLYKASPNQRRLHQHVTRLETGLAPTRQLVDSMESPAAINTEARKFDERWRSRYPKIIGRSDSLSAVFRLLDRVSGSEGMVLICGESGTGKELVAEALHTQSPRRSGPFIKVNCAAFVETLLLSELFGHEKGAFTGATSSKKGRFELAHGGTLFLDEIGDISPNTQVALLRVLQEGTLDRVGGSETISVDVRVICATHRNLERMVADGTFRMDLYYRLRGLTIDLPPLRDRKRDIPALAGHFLAKNTPENSANRISASAMASLIQHKWPGNVRELENVIRSAALFAETEEIQLNDLLQLGHVFKAPLPDAIELLSSWNKGVNEFNIASQMPNVVPIRSSSKANDETELTGQLDTAEYSDAMGSDTLMKLVEDAGGLGEFKKKLEFDAIAYTLKATKGNITQAAGRLGMKRPRLSQIISANDELIKIKKDCSP